MCGIVGIVGLPGSDERARRLRQMAASIEHRGPDSFGFLEEGRVAFGFRRLAILDLSAAGDQPMSSPDGQVSIVFNGEIYNFIELANELRGLGHTFRSSSDTEVLLHAYLEWGKDCVQRLNGMWAFLIFDRRTGMVCGSRDRFGIKPMFVSRVGDVWLFGSEIKALVASAYVEIEPDWSTIADFLVLDRLDHTEATFFAGIRRVPAATWFEIDAHGGYRDYRFWSVPSETIPIQDAPTAFAELFEDAMRLHQRSDVPVAVHLSGGLDSTSILCALRRVQSAQGAPVVAFSFMCDEYDEREFINDTIAMTKATLQSLGQDAHGFWETLAPCLHANDEPVHSMTALVSYALMQETAARGTKVVLNGQGADETLAGYPSYFQALWHEVLMSLGLGQTVAEMRRYAAGYDTRVLRLITSQLSFSLRARLGRRTWYRHLARFRSERSSATWGSADLLGVARQKSAVSWDVGLKEVLRSSIEEEPLPVYLRIEDRNAMAHSVESRVPFLDYRLVEMALRLPSTELLHGQWNKWLLRRAMKGRIPESVRTRVKKMGFPVPAAEWLRGPLWDAVQSKLQGPVIRQSGLFDLRQVDADLARFKQGEDTLVRNVFSAVQFAVWWDGMFGEFPARRSGAPR